MKAFTLALIAIFLLLGCVLAQAEHHEHEHHDESSSSSSSNEEETEAVHRATPAPTHKATPAPSHATPAPSHATPAPSHATPAPSHATPAPSHATPAPAKATPKPTTKPTTKPSSSSSSSSSSTGTTTTVGLCDIVPTSEEPLKLLVPLYVYPGSAWTSVADGASSVPTIAIINPNSGPDTSGPDSSYTSYMKTLNEAGVQQIGYVHTSYGARAISDVETDIDTYVSLYSYLEGIFFDEASDSSSELSYYTELYNYVLGKGYSVVILNPGTTPDSGYVDISTSIVVFEDSASNYPSSFSSFVTCASTSAAKTGYKYKFASIAYAESSSTSAGSLLSTMQNVGMGLVYVTDGASGCCTYNDLVSYYASEVSSVASVNA